jgi:hypothetical protein
MVKMKYSTIGVAMAAIFIGSGILISPEPAAHASELRACSVNSSPFDAEVDTANSNVWVSNIGGTI